MLKKLYVIGAGPGNVNYVSLRAREILLNMNEAYAVERLAADFSSYGVRSVPYAGLADAIKASAGPEAAVLISGDAGFYSVSSFFAREDGLAESIEIVPGTSSMQYFFARTGGRYDDVKTVSLHGRSRPFIGTVTHNEKTFLLTGGDSTPGGVCRALAEAGLGDAYVTVGEKLSYPDEKIVSGKAYELADTHFMEPACLLVRNDRCVKPWSGFSDGDFDRGNVPMTKEETRILSAAKLRAEPCHIVYDIGAGTGAMACELARKAYEGEIYAVDYREEALELVRRNSRKLECFNVIPVSGRAPDVLRGLPVPDRAFIGGASGALDEILRCLFGINRNVRVVVNAATVETLHAASEFFKKMKISYETVCVNVSRSKNIGGLTMMTANNPIYVISAGGDIK